MKRRKNADPLLLKERLWKIAYVAVCLAIIALTAFQLFVIYQDPSADWDYRVYSGAVQAFDHAQNPYILEDVTRYVGGDLPFTYPPHTLYFFWILDLFSVFENIVIYYALLVVLLVISCYLIATIDNKPDYLFLITLLVTGFMGTVWNFGTGNKDIMFLVLFALIFVLLVKKKYWQSSIVMGLTAAISLITGPFVAIYLVVKRPVVDRLTYILVSGGVVALLFLLSYCVNPTYFASYIDTLRGGTSPLYDIGGYNTPTPYLMFGDLLKGVNISGIIPIALVSCAYIGIILYATWKYYGKNRQDTLEIYSIVMFAIFMMLPRIKPYDFIILTVPLYFLFRNCSYRMKILMFAIISLPIFGWYMNFLDYPYDIPFLLGIYTQTYSMFLIFIVIILYGCVKRSSARLEKNPA